jgi:hypothetical protein
MDVFMVNDLIQTPSIIQDHWTTHRGRRDCHRQEKVWLEQAARLTWPGVNKEILVGYQ